MGTGRSVRRWLAGLDQVQTKAVCDTLVERLSTPAQVERLRARVGIASADLTAQNLLSRAYEVVALCDNRGPDSVAACLKHLVDIVEPEDLPGLEGKMGSRTILVVCANPLDTPRLKQERELELIESRLAETALGRKYVLTPARATRVSDLPRLFLEHTPSIVHFSGHGAPNGDLVFEDDLGAAKHLDVAHLTELIRILGERRFPECIVLNACYTIERAQALADLVECVIGMSQRIGDDSALRFSGGFYRGLAFGEPFETAFLLGCNEIDLEGLPDSAVPRITNRDGAILRPEEVRK